MASSSGDSKTSSHPLRLFDYLTLNAYWFSISYLWNSMGPILLPALVTLLVPESQKGGALGTISALGLIVAIIVQPAAGAWSDAHTSRWGRRRPYIVVGTLFDVLFLLAMAFSGEYLMLLLAYLLLQTSSNVAHGPYQGYIPELVPEAKRGAVTGVKQFMEIAGMVITSLAIGSLVGQGQMLGAFLTIIAILLLGMGVTALFVTEKPFDGAPQSSQKLGGQEFRLTNLGDSLRLLFHSRDFFLWLVSRLAILVGANLVRNYALYFFRDVLGLSNPAAAVGNLLAIIAVSIAIVVYPSGALSDRFGRKWLIIFSGVLGAIGSLLLMTATTQEQALIYGSIIGISAGIFLSVNWAWGADLIPASSGGWYLGVSNLATAGSGVLAGVGGFMLDYFNAQSHNLGYTALYLSGAICYFVGTAIAFGVKDPAAKARQSRSEKSSES